jgi:hypothetical protein
MRAALLTAKDLGPSFSASKGDTTTVKGCQPLADMLNSASSGQRAQVQAEFAAEGLGPFLGETLTTRRDQADLAREYDKTRTALARCRSLSFLSGGTKLTFALSPINFGGPGSAAARLDGTYQDVQINGYLAIDKIGPVVFAYYFFQVESGSSQLAYAYYKQADAKVRRVLHADGASGNAH